MGNTTSEWKQSYEVIEKLHDEAYHCIDTAIMLEELEKPHDALDKYKEGIHLIDKALDTRVTCPENPDDTWKRACDMIQKMKKARAEVLMRINSITSAPNFIAPEPLTEIQESEAVTNEVPRTYTELAVALNDLPVETTASSAEIIYSHDNVKLYFISPEGTVTQTSEAKTLNIAVIPSTETVPRRVFLQIDDWVYPLVPGVSPCYRTSFGAFILPDLHAEEPGSSVGIILPEDADKSVYEILEDILHGIISEGTVISYSAPVHKRSKRSAAPTPPAPFTVSGMISNGLAAGGYYISQGLIQGAQTAGKLLNYGTPKLINYLTPASEAATVSPSIIKGFEIASEASSTAAQVTGFVAEKVGIATHALGRYLAPHLQRQGAKLLTSGFNMPEEEASSNLNGLLTIAAGAVEGFSSVYQGLEASASILGNSLSNNTVSIVQHKYGDTAGHLAGNTFNTVGNVLSIGSNTKFFTPKGIAKTAAKETGKAIVEDIKIHNFMNNSNTLYPNLPIMEATQKPSINKT